MRSWLVLFLVGCTQPDPTPTPFEIEAQLPTPLDVLVVVDDTAIAQTGGIPNPANLGGVLEGIYNGLPDFQIAVTTSTTGILRTSAAVPTGVIHHHVLVEDGSLETNYAGELGEAIHSVMGFTDSTGPNAPLSAASVALATNFTRPDAAVGVIVVSASDDASSDTPAAYATQIRSHANKTMISAVHPDGTTRIAEALAAMTYRYEQPITQYDMETISSLAAMFKPPATASCFPLAVTSGSDCELATAHDHVSIPLRECTGDEPCFSLVADSSCASGWTILFGGAFQMYHPTVIGRCTL